VVIRLAQITKAKPNANTRTLRPDKCLVVSSFSPGLRPNSPRNTGENVATTRRIVLRYTSNELTMKGSVVSQTSLRLANQSTNAIRTKLYIKSRLFISSTAIGASGINGESMSSSSKWLP
jgi:hypothetical protein